MTPAQIEQAARRRHNSESSAFWASDEIMKIIYEAELIIATECLAIENIDTSITTVASTRAYTLPTNVIALKRVEWNGVKLQPISFSEDDIVTLDNADTTTEGDPQFYSVWEETIYLRPIPSSAEILKLYSYEEPTLLTTASSSMSVPSRFHQPIIDYVVAIMAEKDELYELSDRAMARWNQGLDRAKRQIAKMKRGDSFAVVKDEDMLANTVFGVT